MAKKIKKVEEVKEATVDVENTETKNEEVVEEKGCECGGKDGCCCKKEKLGFFKKTWKYVVTGVTCAAVAVGVTLGADSDKVLNTLTEAQAKQVAMAAAAYSAEQVLNKVTAIPTAESKAQAVKEVLVEVQAAMPQFMEAANAAKDTAQDVKEEVEGIKDAVAEQK
jgi:hypothetical protein